MAITGAHGLDIAVPGCVACLFLVVPVEVHASKLVSGPVSSNFVRSLECIKEVFSMAFVHVFNTEVINNKDKHDRMPFLLP